MSKEQASFNSEELIESFQSWLSNNKLELVTTREVPERAELFPVPFIIETFLEIHTGKQDDQDHLEVLTVHFKAGRFFRK